MRVYKCNECGKEIPIIKKEMFGRTIETLDCGQLKCEQLRIDNRFLNPDFHLCKPCAKTLSAKIDYELLKFKMEILQEKVRK